MLEGFDGWRRNRLDSLFTSLPRVSKEPAYLLTARDAGLPCLDLSQQVSVTRAIQSDLISKSFPAASVQARLPYLHIEDIYPFFKRVVVHEQ